MAAEYFIGKGKFKILCAKVAGNGKLRFEGERILSSIIDKSLVTAHSTECAAKV